MVIHATFEPQPDITAYEVAEILTWISAEQRFSEQEWKELKANIIRHFKRLDET